MTLRTRLVLAFVYILATIIVALTVPLAVNLSGRARAEFETETLIVAQTLAAVLDRDDVADPIVVRDRVRETLTDPLRDTIERIVVVDPAGAVVWDSAGEEPAGSLFATPGRPEVADALDPDVGANADVRFSREEGRDLMVAAAPVIDETIVGAVRLTRQIDDVNESVRNTVVGLVVIGGAGLLAGVLIAFGLASSFARPIQRLAGVATRLGHGQLDARVGDDVRGAKEIQELASSFDEMADRVERTVRAQREFVANASHQLRTPLTGMKLQLEAALAEERDARQRARLEAADREVDRLAQIVERLLGAAREIEEGAIAHTDLGEAARRAAERWRERAERHGSALRVGAAGPNRDDAIAVAVANPADVDQVLDNLIDNALAHGAGPVELAAGRDDRRAWLRVRDHGPGIPEEERDKVTERFFRGRGSAAPGSGLGLAIARDLTEKWGGSLAVVVPQGGPGNEVVARFRAADAGAEGGGA